MDRMDAGAGTGAKLLQQCGSMWLLGFRWRDTMKRLALLVAKVVPVVCLLLVSIAGWTQDEKNKSDIEKRIENAAKVLDEIMAIQTKEFPTRSWAMPSASP
jgi:hypothetical protein